MLNTLRGLGLLQIDYFKSVGAIQLSSHLKIQLLLNDFLINRSCYFNRCTIFVDSPINLRNFHFVYGNENLLKSVLKYNLQLCLCFLDINYKLEFLKRTFVISV